MFSKTYEDCTYVGGFEGTRASDGAALTLASDQFLLRRPRTWRRTPTRVWAKWSAVTGFDARPCEEGARIEITTKLRGTGIIEISGVDPADVWKLLDGADDLRDRIPPDVRQALDQGTPVLERSAGDDDGDGEGAVAGGAAGEAASEDEEAAGSATQTDEGSESDDASAD